MGMALLIAMIVAPGWVYLLAEAVAAACFARRGFRTLPGFASESEHLSCRSA